MLNMGCVTAQSPVRRQYSVTADGNVEAELPSWSLIEELVGELPEEADGHTQSLLMLAKEGAPKDELTKMVTDLKEKIEPWRTDAQATLQKSIDAVHACATAMEGSVAQWPEKKSKCDVQSNSHESCREEESKKFQSMMHWKGQRSEKKEIMDTECKIFDDVKKEVRAAKASYSNGNVESYMESVCDEFGALQPRYEDAKKKCAAAKAEHARVSELYETAESAHTAEKKVCNEKQTQTEVSYCQYALTTKGTCDSYGTCYEDKVAEYRLVKEIVESEEKLKKVEWRVYSRIECLLPVLGTDDADAIETCRKKTYSLEGIAYLEIPGKDACTIEAAYPGTNAYDTAHMAPLPDDAKGIPVAKCVGLSAQVVQAAAETIDCSSMGGTDCGTSLGSWAGPSTCVHQVSTNGGSCKSYCAVRNMACAKGMDNSGTCTLNEDGHDRQTTEENGCLQAWGDQICACQASCKPKSTATGGAGYNDGYRGWYDVQGCGTCLDYCRWVGNSGSGGSPTKLKHGESWWSCRLAGDSSTYSGKDHFSSWSYAKCSGEGAKAP